MSNETWKADIFESLFQRHPDPWGFESSPYEEKKLRHVLQCLPSFRISFVVELGCAIGVGTLALARRCERVLGVDASKTALDMAMRRCKEQKQVRFLKAFLPAEYPVSEAADCDFILISEVLYFLNSADIQKLAVLVTQSLVTNGSILIVNWTGLTDTPCTGDEAAECFIRACHEQSWRPDLTERGEGYRIDRLSFAKGRQKQDVPFV
ncbi:methyltransferase type 12 [Gluconobacter japonicus]|nr:methyltransferase type 12 [Gluconobacter japonicus]